MLLLSKKTNKKPKQQPLSINEVETRNKDIAFFGFFLSFLQLVSSFQTVAAVFVGVKRDGPSTSETADLQFS